MLLPPKSARKAVRIGCAKTLNSLSHIYASLMSAWITNTPTSKELKSGQSQRASSFRSNLGAVALQVRNLQDTAKLARWEGNVRGHWPYAEYDRLVDVQQEVISVLAQASRISVWELRTLVNFRKKLASALAELDDEWRTDFLHHTKVLNPNFVRISLADSPLCTPINGVDFAFQISDVLSVFSLVAQSLRTGEPMHAVLPQNLLDRLLYHDVAAYGTPSGTSLDHIRELRSPNYLFYATSVISVFQIAEVRGFFPLQD